jgi:cytochrome P450
MVFNAQGPRNRLWNESMQDANAITEWILDQCSRDSLEPGGLGRQVFEAADAGEITEQEAGMLVRSLLSAGLDTTINGIASALYCFASFPEQWQRLRENPKLVRSAIDEVLRFQGAVTNFFRTTTRDVNLAGVEIPAGEKLLVLFAAGNRDPKRWEVPTEFQVERDARGHLGFGAGVHRCVGQMVARLELEIVLAALLEKAERIELSGEPKIRLNNSLRGLESLPLRLITETSR